MQIDDKTAFFERISVVIGDITKIATDAIVNAASDELLGGKGVDGAIHEAAGPELLSACRCLNGCGTGASKITQGYQLPAKYVIHTVGPIWSGGSSNEEELLRRCYTSALDLAIQHECESIAFPAISCGFYGYPVNEAVSVAVKAVVNYQRSRSSKVRIIFCCFNPRLKRLYDSELESAIQSF